MASFDDKALSSLTAKIDQKLSDKTKGGDKKKQSKLPQEKSNLKPKLAQEKPNLKRKFQQEKPERAAKKTNNQPKQGGKNPNGSRSRSDILLEEIRALGGNEKDLELVADVDSDDENLGGQDGADKALQAELAKFAAGLGFEKVKPDEPAEEEQLDEDDNEEDQWEESTSVEEDAPVSKAKNNDQTAGVVHKGKRKTIFEPRPDWHAAELNELPVPSSDQIAPYNPAMAALKEYAKTLLDEDSKAYSATLAASSSHKFMSTIMSSGTISDRTSALTLAIQESPVHSIKSLESLMVLAAKRSRGQAIAAAAALVDLLGPGNILPPNRRLHKFSMQSGLIGTLQKSNVKSWSPSQAIPGKITAEHLISWAFEDWLKEAYFKVIQSLEMWCDDEVEYSRQRAVDMVYALLKDKPEQESNLMRLLVNKLGDRERKIASRASFLLRQLLILHPGMKAIVVKTVEQEIIFRPGQSIRSKYYAITTLNQTILSSKEPQIADALLTIYFGLFVSLLKSGTLGQLDSLVAEPKSDKRIRRRTFGPSKKAENLNEQTERDSAEKLVAAILTGINRAVPFSEADSSTLEFHLDTLFRITHSSNFNTSIQALMLIQQLSSTRHLATERFYRTLYESLLDPRLATSSKQALYLNLLYRSLKSDVDVRRVKAFVKRILQILNVHQPSFVCGILYLVMELNATFPDLKTLLNDAEEHDDVLEAPDEAASTTQPSKDTRAYDGRKRDPEYSNAHLSCLWELLPFLQHFHPSVHLYASSLMNGEKPAQKPDLANHTLIHFLDKFVYRNAKATDAAKGTSIMQPVTANGQGSALVSSKPSTRTSVPLNSAAFWNQKAEDVAVEDVFFHEYFSQVGKPGQAEREKTKKTEGGEEEDSEADEDEIWNALTSSRPEVQGDSESELGSDFEDLMDVDGSDDDLGEQKDEADVDGESDVSGMDFSDEDDDEGEAPKEKEKAGDDKPQSERAKRRKMLKGLPTFASADDYAQMLAQEEGEDGI